MKYRCHSLRHDDGDEAEINLTPLIDIVFILLIFFLVTTTFIRDAGVDIQRPAARSAEPAPTNALILAIRADGELWIDRHPIDIRSLRSEIERLHHDRPSDKPGIAVIVQADRNASVGLLVRVMDQIRQAGISDISVAADNTPGHGD